MLKLKAAAIFWLVMFSDAQAINPELHPKPLNAAVIGIVEKIAGECFVIRAGRKSEIPLAIGFRVFENDTVLTNEGKLHVRYKDGTFIELSNESAVRAERIRYRYNRHDEIVFRFLRGVLRVVSPKKEITKFYTVKTSHATAQVSTDSEFFLIQPHEDRDLTVGVIKGKVEIMSEITNNFVEVTAGTAAIVKLSGLVSSVGSFRASQVQYLKDKTRL